MKTQITARFILSVITVTLFMSCGQSTKHPVSLSVKKVSVASECPAEIVFSKKSYHKKDPSLVFLFSSIQKIDSFVSDKKATVKEQTRTKFGNSALYTEKGKVIKRISEIFIRDLGITAIKHEIFFLDKCNTIAKMTKYVYGTKRIKAIYYFSFSNNKYLGCIVTKNRPFSRKSGKLITITDDLIAQNWSKRIYQNMIKPYVSE